jgi:hypothetical protein
MDLVELDRQNKRGKEIFCFLEAFEMSLVCLPEDIGTTVKPNTNVCSLPNRLPFFLRPHCVPFE